MMEKAFSLHLYLSYKILYEEEDDYKAAVNLYERGHDAMYVIRLCLENLNNREKTFFIIRTSTKYLSLRNRVTMIADCCEKKPNILEAIEF